MSLSQHVIFIATITISSMKLDPLSIACNPCQYHQDNISNHMLNITTTCLYPSCTKITTYHHNIFFSTKYQLVPCINLYHNLCHQPCTITSASTMYQTCTIPSINHVPYHVSIMYHTIYLTMYLTMFQPCTSTMYINTIPCTNKIC
jgi:hypothetical protein